MPKKTIFFAIFMVAAATGLAGGFFLRAGENQKAPTLKNDAKTLAENLPADKTATLSFLDRQAPGNNNELPGEASGEVLTDDKNTAFAANLTDSFTENFVADFFRRNSDGPVQIDNQWTASVPLEEDIAQMLLQSNSLFQNQELESNLLDSDIIIAGNSEEAYKNYLAALRDVIGALRPEKNRDGGTIAFSNQVKAIEKTVADFQNIPVPSDFKDIHKALLQMLIMEKNVVVAIASADRDPLKAVLAVNILSRFDEKIKTISENIQKIINAR